MSKFLFRKLILPLSLAAAASVLLAIFISWQGLFINLATTLLGSLITVVYIDRVIREHEQELWNKVEAMILQRYARLANQVVLQLREVLQIGPDFFDFSGLHNRDVQLVQLALADAVEGKLPLLFQTHIARLDQAGWKRLVSTLQSLIDEGDKLIGLYGQKLDPQQMQLVLDLQENLSMIIASHSLFPDLLGLPDSQMAQTRIVDAREWRDTGIALCLARLRNVAQLCAQMMRTGNPAK